MKLLILVGVFTAMSACRTRTEDTTASLESVQSKIYIEKLSCVDKARNVGMIIERSPTESTVPLFNIKKTRNGVVYQSINEARVVESTKNTLFVQKNDAFRGDRTGVNVTAGWDGNEGSYVEVANGGLSPLPGTFYTDCKVDKY